MIINRAIVSTDNNPVYYEFWPLVAKAWHNIEIEPTVGVVGNLNLNYAFGTILKFPMIVGIPSDFVAQVIRFIIPCFYPDEVSVISDMDMIPLNRDYFKKCISQYNDDQLLIFSSDAYKTELRYPMCYIAGKGKYFQEIIGLDNLQLDTIAGFIRALYALDKKWDTDELFFAEQLHKSALLKNTVFLNRNGWAPFANNRIDRVKWQYSKLGLSKERYIDAHCLRPLHENTAKVQDICDYVEKSSDGKQFLIHLFKKPIRFVYDRLRLFNQNLFRDKLYRIAEIKSIHNDKNKIIAFSLYGNSPRYTANLDKVIRSYEKLLPDWKCRVYVAKDVVQETLSRLIKYGYEIVIMNGEGVKAQYSNWRFLAIEDKSAEAVIIRDLDSFAIPREKQMVEQWLATGKQFHIIRDHVNHNTRIMAGMWGIRRNAIDIRKESRKQLMINAYGIDQVFLEKIIYPLIKDDVFVHDRFPRFPDEDAVIIPLAKGENFIGEVTTDDTIGENGHEDIRQHLKKNFTIS